MLLASGIEASYPQLSNDIKGLCDSAEATLHTTIEETIPDAGEVQIEPRDCPQTARGRRVDAMHIRALSRTRTRGGIPAARAVSSKPLIFSAPQPECSMSKSTKSAPEERAMRAMPWLPNSKPSARSGRLRRRAVDERGSNASQVLWSGSDLGGLAAVDGEQGARDERRVVGCEEERRGSELRRLADPAERKRAAEGCELCLVHHAP